MRDLTGLVFGRLRVVVKDTGRHWKCACACGAEARVRGDHLRNGAIRSCGCFHDETARFNNRKHGAKPRGAPTAEYRAWCNMIDRCERPSNRSFAHYGGRGISICERWRSDFAAFLADVGARPSPEHSIDRIDVDGNYEPENVRWATRKQQARNTRKRRLLTANGTTKTLAEWAEATGTEKRTIFSRLKYGWTHTEAVFGRTKESRP